MARQRGPTSGRLRSFPPRSLAAAVVAVTLVATACGAGNDSASAPEPTNPTTAPSPSDPEAEVEAAYRAHRDMFRRLLESPDPDDPELERRLTGEALDALRSNLRALEEANQALRFGPQYTFQAVSINIEGDEAVVRECVVDEASLIDIATEEIIDPAVVRAALNEINFQHDGNWSITRIREISSPGGQQDCGA